MRRVDGINMEGDAIHDDGHPQQKQLIIRDGASQLCLLVDKPHEYHDVSTINHRIQPLIWWFPEVGVPPNHPLY